MKHQILFLGKTKDRYLGDGIAEFSSRLNNYTSFAVTVVKEGSVNKNISQQRDKQGRLLLKAVPRGALKIALDAAGRQYTSEQFSQQIDGWEMRGIKQITYLIGGPDGLSREVLDNSDLQLSLSRMTFTHDMVRLLLIEQLYRAYTIKAGEMYHR